MGVSVLHVCDKFGVRGSSIHGVSRLFSWWFPRYDPARYEVSLCGLKRPEPATLWLGEQGIPVRHLGRGRFDPRILGDLVALARERGARILHVHGYAAADFGRLAARAVGAKLVLHEHFADPRMPAYQALADRLLRRRIDGAIAVSRSDARVPGQRAVVPADRVRLIWNGAPLRRVRPRAPRARPARPARARDSRRRPPVVGSIGRLNAQKGHRFLLEAAGRLLPGRPQVRLLVAGDGDLMADLRQQAATLAIADRVVFAGHRTDVPDLLGALDVFCISSLYEGTPLALFEAMAAGKAIVSTSVDGCREVLEDGVTGVLVPPADAAALASGLDRVLGDATLREGLGRRALAASRRYDVRACVDEMQDFYDDLLSGGRA